jgi:CubicO group peptidase (beta-lactamase class C family)
MIIDYPYGVNMKKKILTLLMVIGSLLFATCSPINQAQVKSDYIYRVPEVTGDGWQTAHIARTSLDEQRITGMIREILGRPNHYNIHSVLIIKNGKLVLEEYFPGVDFQKGYADFGRDHLHGVMSVTKSFTSTLIGIAIDQGMIKGTDADLASFFPEYSKQLSVDGKDKIKLEHLLSMSAGFDWDETTYLYSDVRNPYATLIGFDGRYMLGYILGRPMKDRPGSKFCYNGGLSMLLGRIIEMRSSLKVKEFAQKYLFGPLGIQKYEWGYWDAGEMVPKTDGGLFLRPRDMAKFGYLFVNKGKWNGQQIVSVKWIKEATKEHVPLYFNPARLKGYGYQWWINKFEINSKIIEACTARGWGGQFIFAFPDLNLVVVFTAGNYYKPHPHVLTMMYDIVNDYVLASISPFK